MKTQDYPGANAVMAYFLVYIFLLSKVVYVDSDSLIIPGWSFVNERRCWQHTDGVKYGIGEIFVNRGRATEQACADMCLKMAGCLHRYLFCRRGHRKTHLAHFAVTFLRLQLHRNEHTGIPYISL